MAKKTLTSKDIERFENTSIATAGLFPEVQGGAAECVAGTCGCTGGCSAGTCAGCSNQSCDNCSAGSCGCSGCSGVVSCALTNALVPKAN